MNNLKLFLVELGHKLNYSFSINDPVLRDVKEDGVGIIPNFLNRDICQIWTKELDEIINNPGAIKVSTHSAGFDKRIFGIEKGSSEFDVSKIENYAKDCFKKFSFFKETYATYMANRIVAGEGNLGSGEGWHRDSAFSNQFKVILYLSDVSEKNGPFQYIKKTHGYRHIRVVNDLLKKPLSDRRFTDEDIRKICNHEDYKINTFTGKAGDLIIVNTRGLHRGSIIEQGTRYALTRYNFVRKVSPQIENLLN